MAAPAQPPRRAPSEVQTQRPASRPGRAQSPVRTAGAAKQPRAKRAATEDDGVLIDFDDDE